MNLKSEVHLDEGETFFLLREPPVVCLRDWLLFLGS